MQCLYACFTHSLHNNMGSCYENCHITNYHEVMGGAVEKEILCIQAVITLVTERNTL